MGEYADDAIDREVNGEGGGWIRGPRYQRKYLKRFGVECNRCGAGRLYWREHYDSAVEGNRYKLHEANGELHVCNNADVADDFEVIEVIEVIE